MPSKRVYFCTLHDGSNLLNLEYYSYPHSITHTKVFFLLMKTKKTMKKQQNKTNLSALKI